MCVKRYLRTEERLSSSPLSIPLTRFLPSLARSALEKNLADAAIEINTEDSLEPELENYKCKYLTWLY